VRQPEQRQPESRLELSVQVSSHHGVSEGNNTQNQRENPCVCLSSPEDGRVRLTCILLIVGKHLLPPPGAVHRLLSSNQR
jgi:hypothetical protein